MAQPPPAANSAKLRHAIARYVSDPTREQRNALLETLLAGPLLMAIKELPEGFDPVASEDGTVRFVTAEVPAAEEGEARRVVCGFSSFDALRAKAPAGVWVMLDPRVVLQWIVDTDTDGLMLDPEPKARGMGAFALVSNNDARSVLGLPLKRRGKDGRPLSLGEEPENAIRDAVARLLERSDLESHVIVKEANTGKFVLFARAIDDSVMMVVRASSLARDELERTRMLFDEMAGDLDGVPAGEGAPDAGGEGDDWADFQALFSGDIGQAAKSAMKVFTWAFGFPPGFELEIEEH